MKNNILKYKLQACALLVCVLTFFSSCKDYLYVEPTNQLTLNSFTDVKRLLGGSLRNYQEGNDYLSGVPNVVTFYDEYLILSHMKMGRHSLRSTIQVIKQSLNAWKEKQELQELIVSST